ncbi:MAG: GNAT family N-acetyltransferase, partial [Bacteroidia bacterium]|nr:GNAT family N-acetyltransferase [Bacteroidia bacterium]
MKEFFIRKAKQNDLDQIRFLFRDTVLHINSKNYDQKQIKFWANGVKHINSWKNKIDTQEFFVAVSEEKILGFASVTQEGYLDLMYVHKDHQREGVGKKLILQIEETTRKLKLNKIVSDVSSTAKTFFEKSGFEKTGDNRKEYGDVVFVNNCMEKKLI